MATAKKKSAKKATKKAAKKPAAKVGWAETMRNALEKKQPAGGWRSGQAARFSGEEAAEELVLIMPVALRTGYFALGVG